MRKSLHARFIICSFVIPSNPDSYREGIYLVIDLCSFDTIKNERFNGVSFLTMI